MVGIQPLFYDVDLERVYMFLAVRFFKNMRRLRDSNPRYSFPYTHFLPKALGTPLSPRTILKSFAFYQKLEIFSGLFYLQILFSF